MLREPRYTRDRIAAVARRVQALIYPESRDLDRLEVAGPTGRIPWREARRGQEILDQGAIQGKLVLTFST